MSSVREGVEQTLIARDLEHVLSTNIAKGMTIAITQIHVPSKRIHLVSVLTVISAKGKGLVVSIKNVQGSVDVKMMRRKKQSFVMWMKAKMNLVLVGVLKVVNVEGKEDA